MGTCTCVQEKKTKFVFRKKTEQTNQEMPITPDSKGSKKSLDSEKITRTSIRQSNLHSDSSFPAQGSKVSIDVTPAESNRAQLEQTLKWQSYFQNIAELTPSVILRKGISREQKMKRKKSAQFQKDQMLISDIFDSKYATPASLLEKRTVARRKPEQKSYNVDKLLDKCRAGPLVVPYISYEKYSLS